MKMKSFTCKVLLLCVASLPILGAAGCTSLLPPELRAGAKILGGSMDTLTGVEIQAAALSFGGVVLTDAQADAIAKFLKDNNLATLDDIQALMDQWEQDPSSIQLPDGFEQLFEDFDTSTIDTGAFEDLLGL